MKGTNSLATATAFPRLRSRTARTRRVPDPPRPAPRLLARGNAPSLRHLFYFAEYPAACCGDEGVSRTLRSFSEVGLAATKNSADTSQLAARSFISFARSLISIGYTPVKQSVNQLLLREVFSADSVCGLHG